MFERSLLKAQSASWMPVDILRSDWEWRKTRNAFILVESCCQMCGARKKLEVHHVIPWHVDETLRYDWDNLVTLCRHCHFQFGHHGNWREYNRGILELCGVAREYDPRVSTGFPRDTKSTHDFCQKEYP